MAIPKILHYCWFGKSPLPAQYQAYMDTWKKYCPDWQIMRWDESNFDISSPLYVRQAYEAGKFAFVSDYARLQAVYQYGGVYLDTDVELLRPLDELLAYRGFAGLEHSLPTPCGRRYLVATGLGFGAEPRHPLLKTLLDEYQRLPFIRENGQPDLTACTVRTTDLLKGLGFVEKDELQTLADGFVILPTRRLNPYNLITDRIHVTDQTLSIHHYDASWKPAARASVLKRCLQCTKPGMLIMRMRWRSGAKQGGAATAPRDYDAVTALKNAVSALSFQVQTEEDWIGQQYRLEQLGAAAIRATQPFSDERQEATRLCYDAVARLIHARNRACGQETAAFGASAAYLELLDQLVAHMLSARPHITFYEAGVGTGYVLKHMSAIPEVTAGGCDVAVDRAALGDAAPLCREDGIAHALSQLPDGSIDLFYWNDVMEHIAEDEIAELCALIARKLSAGGILVTITPNRGLGPHDITGRAEPAARCAKGLHLREYSFYEVQALNRRSGLRPAAYVRRKDGRLQALFAHAAMRCRSIACLEWVCYAMTKHVPTIRGRSVRKRIMRRFPSISIAEKSEGASRRRQNQWRKGNAMTEWIC